jgi:membrane protein implicated in regulation of membrane protease activity
MFDFLTELTWWHWIVGAIALAAIETFMPGAVAIWFAASAALIGLLLVVLPQMPWQWQWVLFAALGIVAMLAYRHYKKANPEIIEQPNLNRRGLQYVGQVFTLVEAMRDGTGKIQVGDSVWKVSGPDAPVGARVRVTGADATVLTVEPV